MLTRLHANATTTPRVRAEVQASSEPVRVLVERYGVSETTIYRWRKRTTTEDRSHARHNLGQATSAAEEAIISELRTLAGLSLDDITEVMRVNAHTMDPLFAMEDQATFDDATFARFTEASATIRSTGAALQKPAIAKGFPEGFVTFAKTLETEAGKLGTAAEAKDGAAAGAAIRGIHQTCRGCHDEMR